jgi:hypothetical protein
MPLSYNTVSTLFHFSVTWQEMFWNNYSFSCKPVKSMHYSWMSQQTWWFWHSSWYIYFMFMGGQLWNTSSSANHWKPGQQERIFFKYWAALWHQMDIGGQNTLVSVLMVQKPWQGDIVEL